MCTSSVVRNGGRSLLINPTLPLFRGRSKFVSSGKLMRQLAQSAPPPAPTLPQPELRDFMSGRESRYGDEGSVAARANVFVEEGGRHVAHATGSVWVQSTEVGP
jgi:hypothetical protein